MAGSQMASLKRKMQLKGPMKKGQLISRMNEMKAGVASGMGRLEQAKKYKTKKSDGDADDMKCKSCGMNHKSASCAMKKSATKYKKESMKKKGLGEFVTGAEKAVVNTARGAGSELRYLGGQVGKGAALAGSLGKAFVRNITGGDIAGIVKKRKGMKHKRSTQKHAK